MNATDALHQLRELVSTGLRDQIKGRQLAYVLVENFPDDPRVRIMQSSIVDLLVTIELETILGGDVLPYQLKLQGLLDWAERHMPVSSS